MAAMKCRRCHGSGEEQDDALIGRRMKMRRQSAQLSLRELAGRMRRSHAFLSQLENGRRRWSRVLIDQYFAAIERTNAP